MDSAMDKWIGRRVFIKSVTVFEHEEVREKGRTITRKVKVKKELKQCTLAVITGFTRKSTGIHHHQSGTNYDGDFEQAYLEIDSTYDVLLVRTSMYGKEKMIEPDDIVHWVNRENHDDFQLKKRRDTAVQLNIYKPSSEGYTKVGEIK